MSNNYLRAVISHAQDELGEAFDSYKADAISDPTKVDAMLKRAADVMEALRDGEAAGIVDMARFQREIDKIVPPDMMRKIKREQ